MTDSEVIEQTIDFVKETLKDAEGGHDWFHIQRVFNNTLLIAKDEEADIPTVALAALLHDIADAKFHDGDETLGPTLAENFLRSIAVEEATIQHVVQIITHISFKNSLEHDPKNTFRSKELEVVRDADRLDALGAIGIARTFHYGGFKDRKIYDPEIPPNLNMDKEAYKKSQAPTINHFYEKLLLLKDRMHTATGKKLAEKRHDYMLGYLEQFYKEWNGEDPFR